MKTYFILPLLAFALAGCSKREPEPAILIAPAPPATNALTATPAPTPTSNNNAIIIVPPTVTKPGTPPVPNDKSMAIKPPAIANQSILRPLPTPQPAPKSTAKPTVKPQPTPRPMLKPAPRPTTKPTVKPLAKPIVKPTAKPKPAAVAATAQPTPTLIVRAVLVSTSKVPDPSTVAYSDSLVFSKYRVVSIEKGASDSSEILVAQWGMRGKKLTPAARLRAGDSARLQLVPLDAMPQLDRIMRNDDTGDYDSTPYFALDK